MISPAATGSAMANTFQTILRHPEDMAAAYEKEFGKPVTLSSGMKNAAKLLIRYMIDEGLWPWSVLGDYASRSDMEALQVKKFKVPPYAGLKI